MGPGGICFAHGPFTEMNCPLYPTCESDILINGVKKEYVELGEKQVYENNQVYSQRDLDQARIESRKQALEEAEEIVLNFGKGQIFTAQSAGVVIVVKTEIAKRIKKKIIRGA